MLDKADFIFLHAPGANFLLFFRDNALDKNDPRYFIFFFEQFLYFFVVFFLIFLRIRTIPIPVHRPTLLEVKCIHHWLTSAEISEASSEEVVEQATPVTTKSTTTASSHATEEANKKTHSPEGNAKREFTEEEKKLIEIINFGDLDALKKFYAEDTANSGHVLSFSPLYLAVQHGHLDLVKYLVQLSTADLNVLDVECEEGPLHW